MHGHQMGSCRGFVPYNDGVAVADTEGRLSLAESDVQTLGAQQMTLSSRAGAGKTLEVRRSEAADARGKTPSPIDTERLFLGSVLDRHRPRVALPPFPKAAPPPAKPSEQRQQASLFAESGHVLNCSLYIRFVLVQHFLAANVDGNAT